MKPKLSLVTISFNQRAYLQVCLASILSPKHPDLQYIVVDPGSTDGSRALIDSYGDAVDVRVFAPDKGPGDGLNQGFAQATGDYLYFVNSDDFVLPGALAKMQDALLAAGLPDLLLGGAWIVDGAGAPQGLMRPHGTSAHDLLSGRGNMVQQGMVFRRSLFQAAGGFNAANRTCWDLELLLQMLAQGPSMAFTDARFGAFRIHDDSLSGGAQGAAHEARYRADLERMAQDFGLGTLPNPQGLARVPRAVQKRLGHPRWAAQDLADRLLPGRKARLWDADQREPGPV